MELNEHFPAFVVQQVQLKRSGVAVKWPLTRVLTRTNIKGYMMASRVIDQGGMQEREAIKNLFIPFVTFLSSGSPITFVILRSLRLSLRHSGHLSLT